MMLTRGGNCMAHDNDAIYELHDQLTKKTAQMREALEQTSSEIAEDPTGQVSVRFDDPSIEITIGSFWRASIRPEELSGVILETVNTVLLARLQAWGASFSDEAPDVAAPPAPSPAIAANEISELVASADGDVFHRNVNRFIETFSTQLSSTLSQLSERATQVHGGEDSSGNAQVDLDSRGTIVGLRLDESWLRTADGGDVTDAIRSALSKAQASVAAATPALPFEGTPLAQYAEGMADPVEMIRMLTRGG